MQWRCCRAFLCSPAAMPSMQPAAFAWMYFFFEKMKLHYVTAGAILENAVITGTNFAGADLTGVNFEDVLGYFEAGWPCQCCCAGLPSALIILCKDVCRFRSEKNAARFPARPEAHLQQRNSAGREQGANRLQVMRGCLRSWGLPMLGHALLGG
eukprot:scaffold121070_cov17-Tisochrysis_lutea.AAC.1